MRNTYIKLVSFFSFGFLYVCFIHLNFTEILLESAYSVTFIIIMIMMMISTITIIIIIIITIEKL